MIQRYQIPLLLSKIFLDDFEEVLKNYEHKEQIEITEHLQTSLDLIERFSATNDEDFYKQYRILEDGLLIKYGSRLKPYASKSFYVYFNFDIVLVEKGIVFSTQCA